MDNDDEKYLDPEQNPMIPRVEKSEPLKPGDPDYDYLGRSPMVDWDITPEALAEKIAAEFPDQDEIEIGSRTFARMADGRTFTEKESGKPIEELPLADLLMIRDFLKDREKR